MAKRHKVEFGPDNWLYIISHALSIFREEGGDLVIRSTDRGIIIEFPGIFFGDSRLHEDFEYLVNSAVMTDSEAGR